MSQAHSDIGDLYKLKEVEESEKYDGSTGSLISGVKLDPVHKL
jgi:hypothetical protein